MLVDECGRRFHRRARLLLNESRASQWTLAGYGHQGWKGRQALVGKAAQALAAEVSGFGNRAGMGTPHGNYRVGRLHVRITAWPKVPVAGFRRTSFTDATLAHHTLASCSAATRASIYALRFASGSRNALPPQGSGSNPKCRTMAICASMRPFLAAKTAFLPRRTIGHSSRQAAVPFSPTSRRGIDGYSRQAVFNQLPHMLALTSYCRTGFADSPNLGFIASIGGGIER